MIYLLCLLLPPVAVLKRGSKGQAFLNLLLSLAFWVPGVIHALLVVNGANEDARTQRVVDAINRGGR